MTSLVSAPTLGFSSPLPLPQRKNAWCWTWRLRNLPIRKPFFFLGQDWPRLNEVTQRRRDENGTTANEQATQRKAGPRWTWLEAWPLLWCYKRGLHFKQDLNDIFGSMSFFLVTLNEIYPFLAPKHQSTSQVQGHGHWVTYCKKNKTSVFYFTNNQRVKPRHLRLFSSGASSRVHWRRPGVLIWRRLGVIWQLLYGHHSHPWFPWKGMVINPIVGIFKAPMKKDISCLDFC